MLALLMRDERVRGLIERRGMYLSCVAGVMAFYFMIRYPGWPPIPESMAIAVLMAVSVVRNESRFLSWRPLVWVGLVSYSVYVWQELFFIQTAHSKALQVGFVLLLAIASYYLIERPCIQFSKKFGCNWAVRWTMKRHDSYLGEV
jgi:peptidoglycan/LPS O-acetylase OafA/YrhL